MTDNASTPARRGRPHLGLDGRRSRLTVRLTEEDAGRLRRKAARLGLTASALARKGTLLVLAEPEPESGGTAEDDGGQARVDGDG